MHPTETTVRFSHLPLRLRNQTKSLTLPIFRDLDQYVQGQFRVKVHIYFRLPDGSYRESLISYVSLNAFSMRVKIRPNYVTLKNQVRLLNPQNKALVKIWQKFGNFWQIIWQWATTTVKYLRQFQRI